MFYVYMIISKNKEIYIGSTNDLRRRIIEHNQGKSFSTKNNKWKLVYYEGYFSEKDARTREQKLKQHGMAKAHLKKRIVASLREISAG